ncbi:MAG: phosphatidate cytidylyltransferase [Bacteroidota bacterium]
MTDRPYGTLPRRLAVAIVAIPLMVWLTMQGGYLFLLMVVIMSTLSLREFYHLTEARGAHPVKLLGLVSGILVTGAFVYERAQVDLYLFFEQQGIRLAMFSQLQFLFVVLIIFLLSVLIVELFRTRGSALQNIGSTVSGVLVVSLCFGTLVGLRELFPYGFPVHRLQAAGLIESADLATIHRWGGFTVVAMFASIWMCDTAAYFAGLSFGKHKLFPRVSPGKSWEGGVVGLLAAIGTMLAARSMMLDYLSVHHALVIGILIGVFGQVGDLVESRLKRDAGVKDSSGLLPGHGGMYDRFDSLVFLSPILYLYVDFVVLS